jgi:hypothetical protein
MEEATNTAAVESECLRRFDLLRWELQDVHRDLERLTHLMHQVQELCRDNQSELDHLVRTGG